LIAGCGTGQQSIGMTQIFKGARLLAVDLSLSSLSYAMRKTEELGLTSIEYAQADLLELASLDRKFDIVASVGVLHHLADPFAGWRVLLSLLRDGGFMNLGFYSEIARRDVVKIRAFIAGRGYDATANDIRRCRQDLIDERANFTKALISSDFYSMSACRDLLFHAQEHVMTLAEIGAFLGENGLTFIGFDIDGAVLNAYKRRFPDDPAATNLSQWQIFEHENPDTFAGMYQFWVQKAG
jgi:SAM-dependent methyltransferase